MPTRIFAIQQLPLEIRMPPRSRQKYYIIVLLSYSGWLRRHWRGYGCGCGVALTLLIWPGPNVFTQTTICAALLIHSLSLSPLLHHPPVLFLSSLHLRCFPSLLRPLLLVNCPDAAALPAGESPTRGTLTAGPPLLILLIE